MSGDVSSSTYAPAPMAPTNPEVNPEVKPGFSAFTHEAAAPVGASLTAVCPEDSAPTPRTEVKVEELKVEGQEVAAPAVSEDSSLFSIDTAGAVKRDSPEEEVQLWTCALCQVTIKVRGDGRAEVTHVFGKPHRKKMRAAGLDEKAAEALVGICHNRDATEIQPIITTLKRKADDSLASVPKSMRSADGSTSAKSILNELCQRMHWSVSFTIDQRGEHHCPDFMATAALNRGSG